MNKMLSKDVRYASAQESPKGHLAFWKNNCKQVSQQVVVFFEFKKLK